MSMIWPLWLFQYLERDPKRDQRAHSSQSCGGTAGVWGTGAVVTSHLVPVSAFSSQSQTHSQWVLDSIKVALFSDPVCDIRGQDLNVQPGWKEFFRFGNLRIASLLFADDMVLLASIVHNRQHALERFAAKSEELGVEPLLFLSVKIVL